jgi:hypothetical protein
MGLVFDCSYAHCWIIENEGWFVKTVAWSYSSLTNYEQCPKKFFHTKVQKDIKDPPGEAAKWGTQVHSDLELRIKNKKTLPDELTKFEPLCAKIEASPGRVFTETQYALTSSFKRTGWFDRDVWVRAILDVGVINGTNALILDWKTGKIKHDSNQLKLSAAVIMHTEPDVEKVNTGFVWLKDNKIGKETYTRDQIPEIWQEFMPRVRRLEIAHEQSKWEAKPSGLCKAWCPVTSCEHNGRRK